MTVAQFLVELNLDLIEEPAEEDVLNMDLIDYLFEIGVLRLE
jgi:hypothetical protein